MLRGTNLQCALTRSCVGDVCVAHAAPSASVQTIGLYFSGVMVRLMLTLAPAACMIGGLAITETLFRHMPIAAGLFSKDAPMPIAFSKDVTGAERERLAGRQRVISGATVVAVMGMLFWYVQHCVWVTSEAYSSPSIVLAAKQPDGSRVIFDDYREAYYWLRMNTADDAKVMSWWDYGAFARARACTESEWHAP